MVIRFSVLRLTCRVTKLTKIPQFPGSMLRGGFGINLKRQCCRQTEMCLGECIQNKKCVYGAIFETPLKDISILGKVEKAPRQFSIYPITQGPLLLEPNQELAFLWTIWGKTLDYLPYSVLAWVEFGKKGIGVNRSPAVLSHIEDVFTGKFIYTDEDRKIAEPSIKEFTIEEDNSEASVIIETLSPIRLKYKNKLLGKNEPNKFNLPSDVFFFHLIRRIQNLFTYDQDEFINSLYDRLDEVKNYSSEFKWQEITRYSNRQRQYLQMGGIVGTLAWDSLPSVWIKLLEIGEWLQIGKGTTMGLGKYKLTLENK